MGGFRCVKHKCHHDKCWGFMKTHKHGEIYSYCHDFTTTATQARVLAVLKRIPGRGREGHSREQEQHVQRQEWERSRQLISGLCREDFIRLRGFRGVRARMLEQQPRMLPVLVTCPHHPQNLCSGVTASEPPPPPCIYTSNCQDSRLGLQPSPRLYLSRGLLVTT